MFLCHLENPLESVTNGSAIDAFPEAAYLLKNINVHLELMFNTFVNIGVIQL